MSDTVFATEGLGYRYQPAGKGVVFRAGHLKWSSGELFGVIEVTASHPALPSFLTRQRVNMTGGTGRVSLARGLAARSASEPGYQDGDWLALLESLFVRVGDAESRGAPLEWVGQDEPTEGVPHLVERLVERDGINVLFGPGDQGKSWIALYLRVCVQLGLRCLGLDVRQAETLAIEYETGSDTYTRRLRAVLRGLELPYQKMRLWRPTDALPRQVEALARLISDEGIGFYTVDSAGHASGSPSEHGTWEDAALALGKSLKVHLPATPLLIDHTTAEGSREKLSGRASGAYRKYADARVLWECRRAQEQENAWSLVGLYHTKGNNSMRWHPLGVRMEFESDAWGRATCVRFSRDDGALKQDAEHSGRQSLREQIKDVMGTTEWTVYALAQQIGAPADSVAAKLREMRGRGETRTVEAGKGGRGQVVTWVLEKPDYARAYKKTTIQSGLGDVNDSPNPTTRIDQYPTSRVSPNGTENPPTVWSGPTAGRAEDGDSDAPF